MTDRPMLFSAAMVRALLEGRKTQTRRLAKVNAVMGGKVPVLSPDERLVERQHAATSEGPELMSFPPTAEPSSDDVHDGASEPIFYPASAIEASASEFDRYIPCNVGLHVCGIDEEANEFFTVANFPTDSFESARHLFELAKAECMAEGDEYDVVVDLNLSPDPWSCTVVDDFGMHRQMLDRLRQLWEQQQHSASIMHGDAAGTEAGGPTPNPERN